MRGLSARREIEPRTGSGCTGQCTGLTPDLVSRQALLAINLWYGLPYATVLLVDTPLPEGQWTNTCPYEDRGWCGSEYSIARFNGRIANTNNMGVRQIENSRSWPETVSSITHCLPIAYPLPTHCPCLLSVPRPL